MQKELERGKYTMLMIFLVIIPYIVLTICLFLIIGYKIGQNPNINSGILGVWVMFAFIGPYILGLCLTIILSIKRLANLNMSGFWSLLFLIPVVNIIFLIYLMFAKGKNILNINENNNTQVINIEGNIELTNNDSIPKGIILILVLYGFGILANIINIFFGKHVIQYGPWIISGKVSILILTIITLITGIIFYLILKRKKIGKIITLYYLLYGIIILVINSISMFFSKEVRNFYLSQNVDGYYGGIPFIIILSLLFSIIINILVMYYLYKNKDYFNN